jgi:seryl-tRNA synthetase
MHDIKLIRDDPDAFDAGLKKRGLAPEAAALIVLDDRRRSAIAELQALQERRNAASKEIGQAKAKKDEARSSALMSEVSAIKERMPKEEAALKAIERELHETLAGIPNIPQDDVPVGDDEKANVELRRIGEPRRLNAPQKQHFEIGEALGLMDFDTATKLSGARFVVLKGALARLERALATFMLNLHTEEHGYTEINPPLLVREEVMFGTAQLPKFKEDQFLATALLDQDKFWSDYEAARDAQFQDFRQQNASAAVKRSESLKRQREWFNKAYDSKEYSRLLWLIPTAEVPLTNLAREAITEEAALPMRVTAWTPCFRAEAGAAGKDTRGMIRQHQFSKVELVSVTTPEQSAEEHERMTRCAEEVLKRLDLPFRTIVLSTGDMGFSARKTYDIEVWLPGQNTYREISSCSVCGDFQARRMNARYRPKGGKNPRYVHTLNGSGVAVGRALIAVLENYQNADGSVTVPEVLRPHMGGLSLIRAS